MKNKKYLNMTHKEKVAAVVAELRSIAESNQSVGRKARVLKIKQKNRSF